MALVSLNANTSVVKQDKADRSDSEQSIVSALNQLLNSAHTVERTQSQIDRFDSRQIERSIGHCDVERIVDYVKGIFGLNQLDMMFLLKDVYCQIHNQLDHEATFLSIDYCWRRQDFYFEEDIPERYKKDAQYLIDSAKRRNHDILQKEQRLCQLIDHSVNECAKTVQKLLENADVVSFQELLYKSNHLWDLKQRAQYTYLQSAESIELKKEIDLKTMPQNDETHQCIVDYWAALCGNESMIAHYIKGEGVLKEAYVQMRAIFLKIVSNLDEENACSEKINFICASMKLLEHCLQAGKDIFQYALNELTNIGIKTDSVSFKYFEIKAETVVFTRLKKKLRRMLEEKYKIIAAKYNKSIKKFEGWVARIPEFVESIETFNRRIAELDPDNDDQKKEIEHLQSKQDITRKTIELLNQQTSREYALKYVGEDPEDFIPLLKECEKTEHEFQAIKVCKLKWGRVQLTSLDLLIDPDVHLSISTTEDVLVSLLRARDLECLNVKPVQKKNKYRKLRTCNIL